MMNKIAIFGGTGFVGHYLVRKLLDAGLTPRVLLRPGTEFAYANDCELIHGDIGDDHAIQQTLQSVDAVIYNIGILREFPSRGITFKALQQLAPERVIEQAKIAGVQRFLLMSANGVEQQLTPYQRTKLAAENALKSSGLEWSIFRPSVIFGEPNGKMEFATQLNRDMIQPPFPVPLFFSGFSVTSAGSFKMSPVHIENVSAAFVHALTDADTIGQSYTLCGPESLSWRQMIERLCDVLGKHKLLLPTPVLPMKLAAHLFDRFAFFPITRDQIKMLFAGNTGEADDLIALGITPLVFDKENLSYLSQNPY